MRGSVRCEGGGQDDLEFRMRPTHPGVARHPSRTRLRDALKRTARPGVHGASLGTREGTFEIVVAVYCSEQDRFRRSLALIPSGEGCPTGRGVLPGISGPNVPHISAA